MTDHWISTFLHQERNFGSFWNKRCNSLGAMLPAFDIFTSTNEVAPILGHCFSDNGLTVDHLRSLEEQPQIIATTHSQPLQNQTSAVRIKFFWSPQIVCLKWQVLGATSLLQLLLFWFELCKSGQTCPPNPNLPSISNAVMPQFKDRGYIYSKLLAWLKWPSGVCRA